MAPARPLRNTVILAYQGLQSLDVTGPLEVLVAAGYPTIVVIPTARR
jgi:putative intracellular protease/amidase